jgi:RHS repeat-associated protein
MSTMTMWLYGAMFILITNASVLQADRPEVLLLPPGLPVITAGNNYGSTDTVPNNTRTVTFSIYWAGNLGETSEVEYSLTCSGAASCTAQSGVVFMSKSSQVLDLPVTYTTGATGTGAVTLVAEGPNSATSTIAVNLPIPPTPGLVAVTPAAAADTFPTSATSAVVSFAVSNNGGTSLANITLQAFCSGTILNCVPSPSTINSLAAGASQPVTISFNTSSTAGSGVAQLVASVSGPQADTGQYALTVVPATPVAPLVHVDTVLRLDRSNCVTAVAGPRGAFQCGDLVLTHSMPAYRTMNEDRVLTLVYNSATASVQNFIPVRVTVPASAPVPDEVRAVVSIGGLSWTFSYLGSSFAIGQTRRLSLSFDASTLPAGTGIYSYQLSITSYYGGTPYTAPTVPGEVVIVDRKRTNDSPYGVGWSVAGLSRLYAAQAGRNALLIVESDGSFTTYNPVAVDTFVAVRGAFRDTVFFGTFDPGIGGVGTYYLRRHVDRSETYYDNLGRIRWETDRRPQFTEYSYINSLASSPLAAVRVPPWQKARSYTFSYSSSRLDYITDPAGRQMDVSVNASGELTSILDPGLTSATTFGYINGTLLQTWTSPRAKVFSYGYNGSRDLLISYTPMVTGASATNFLPSQLTGYALAGAAPDSAGADTLKTIIRGPRGPGVGDTVAFFVDKWGSPTRIVDALGRSALLERSGSMPFLITGITYPNGAKTSSRYNVKGVLVSIRDSTPDWPAVQVAVTEFVYGSGQNRAVPTLVRRLGDTYNDSTIFTLNTRGLVASSKGMSGLVTLYIYNTDSIAGALTARVDSVTTFLPNTLTKAKRRLVTRFTHDDLGNVITSEDPAGNVITYHKDPIGRDTAIVNQVGRVQKFTYSAYNQLLTATAYGAPTDSIPSRQTTYGYNQDVLQSVKDPRVDPLRTWLRDEWGRTVRETDDYNNSDSTKYDPAGNVIEFRPRSYELLATPLLTMRYDRLNRLEARKWPSRATLLHADSSVAGDSIVYEYNSMDLVTSAKSSNDHIVREYYANGLLKKETQKHAADTATHQYVYDRLGRRKEYHIGSPTGDQDHIYYTYPNTYAEGRPRLKIAVQWRDKTTKDSVVIRFDEMGRRDTVFYYVQGEQPTTVAYGYDHAGTLRWVCAKHETDSGFPTDLLNFNWFAEAVDSANRVTSVEAKSGFGCSTNEGLQYERQNTFDGYGQLKSQATGSRRSEYRYDASGNMIARQIFNPDGSNLRRWDYVIDPGHNRIQSYTWRYREGSVRTLGIGHDKSQSRIAEAPTDTLPTPTIFQQRAYYYDALERVTGTLHYEVSRSTVEIYNPWWHREILGPNLFGETAHNAFDSVNVSITTPIDRPNACRYDPAGRMWDPCDDNGPSSLAFDGENVVRTGGDLALARYTFLHGPGVDDPLLGHRTGGGVGETVIYITNGMGDVFSIARASGHASLSQSSSHNPTYAGASNNLDAYENNRTGAFNASLVYYRNRFYDPETARWTQEDPMGVAGGVNLFAYGNNNPASNTDRFGLAPDDCKKEDGSAKCPYKLTQIAVTADQIDMSNPGAPSRNARQFATRLWNLARSAETSQCVDESGARELAVIGLASIALGLPISGAMDNSVKYPAIRSFEYGKILYGTGPIAPEALLYTLDMIGKLTGEARLQRGRAAFLRGFAISVGAFAASYGATATVMCMKNPGYYN